MADEIYQFKKKNEFRIELGSDGLLSSPMSPDEEIIKRRGQIRTSPRKRAFQTSTPAITEIGSTPEGLAAAIFGRGSRSFVRSTGTATKKKKGRMKTWTCTFVCLSNCKQAKVPNAEEKTILHKAGLGYKRITMEANLSTEEMVEFLQSRDNFPQLSNVGGFEFLRCKQNCRDLEIIEFNWTPSDFRNHIGSQGKIYLRPIQKDINTTPVAKEVIPCKKEVCDFCKTDIDIRELRSHLETCQQNNGPPETPSTSNAEREHTTESNRESLPSAEVEEAEIVETEEFENRHIHVDQEDTLPNRHDAYMLSDDSSDIDLPSLRSEPEDSVPENNTDKDISSVLDSCCKYIQDNNMMDPVTILRYIQKEIVTGRDLEIKDPTTITEGRTNYILVDRHNIIKTGFEEIENLNDLRPTLEVNFYGETAEDYGGPRKEFFRLILPQIHKKYFDPIPKHDIGTEDYVTIGKIYALSILQNGKVPQFAPDILAELYESSTPRPAIEMLRKGMDTLGLYQIGRRFPVFLHLMKQTHMNITFRKLTNLLKPEFHESGSNARNFENMVYNQFLAYAREAANLTDTSLDTSTSTTGIRTPTRKSAADGVRKRLLLSTSYVSSDPEDSPCSKQPAPAAKKRKTNKKSGNLPISARLCALSSEQLAGLIEKLVTNHPEIRDEVEKSIPKPDIENLIENLEYFKKNIFKSLPYTRWGSSRDAFCFRRVKTHVESFKRTCINQGKQLLEAGSWEASMEYILEAWDVINQTPDWDNIAHNKSKEMCFRTLATQFKKSLKESTLSKESYEDLKERIENAAEMNNELHPCIEMVAKKMQKIK